MSIQAQVEEQARRIAALEKSLSEESQRHWADMNKLKKLELQRDVYESMIQSTVEWLRGGGSNPDERADNSSARWNRAYSMEQRLKANMDKPLWTVRYDGPSRPIICGPLSSEMYSISKFINGRWDSFESEEKFCQLLCDKFNEIDARRPNPIGIDVIKS